MSNITIDKEGSMPTHVRIDKDTYEWIKDDAKRENRSISQELQYLIKKGIDVQITRIQMSLGADLRVALRNIEEDRAAAYRKEEEEQIG